MTTFKQLVVKLQERYKHLEDNYTLFVVDVSKDNLWNFYQESLENNEIAFENKEYDCNSCKKFIRNISNVVAIEDNKLLSIWDLPNVTGEYKSMVDKMNHLMVNSTIKNKFIIQPKITINRMVGGLANTVKPDNKTMYRDKIGMTFHHFNVVVKADLIKEQKDSILSKVRSRFDVYKRSCEELTQNSINTVKDLIAGDLYRGEEHLQAVLNFEVLLKGYSEATDKNIYLWRTITKDNNTIKNTVIGTLLVDVQEKSLEEAVEAFESKVAPSSYKRSNAVVTPRMKQEAMKLINSEGIEESLYKRYAELSDVSVNDVLYVDSSVSNKMQDGIAGLMEQGVTKSTTIGKIRDSLSIEEFIETILPKSTSIEMLVENKHQGNLVSLIAPKFSDAPNIQQWDNNFSWAYKGGVTDSMKERVRKAGGRVDGVFRFTHSWNELEPNVSLMDLHVFMPGCTIPNSGGGPNVSGRRVGWNRRIDRASGGVQDVDYTDAAPENYIPVENITFPDITKMPEGTYTCKIHNWDERGTSGRGKAEIELNGKIHQYTYPSTNHHEWVPIAEVTLKSGIFSIKHLLPTSTDTQNIWDIKTNELVKVNSIMYSPNYWGDNKIGNKHFMFILEDCQNPDEIRGLYNEHLSNKYKPLRKSIDMLSTLLMCEPSDKQISGLGFSSTLKTEFTVVVRGKDVSGTYVIKV